ncbi:hypothetical protein QBC38DRAFT_483382 [Podospora fimiseda]|uniref:C2H2-type domain-containing protein n=1 Tax=Podospora fimiseda TaxID=252190 RepID=A0AAN7BKM3_9PEZI|nr:hypothetical protein QBC38DRAFT_483382 [Podospora fimiseda]
MESHMIGRVPVGGGSGEIVTAHLQVHGSGGRARGRSEDSGIAMDEHDIMDRFARSSRDLLKLPFAAAPPTPELTPDHAHFPSKASDLQFRSQSPALLLHRHSMSVDSGVVMELDRVSMSERSCASSLHESEHEHDEANEGQPFTPRTPFRLSGFLNSPQLSASPTSAHFDAPSPSEQSDDSQGWDLKCIGENPENEQSVEKVRVEMEAVTLQPCRPQIPHRQSSLETIKETDDASDVTLEAEGDAVSTEEADRILAFSLPTVRGISRSDVPNEVLEVCRSITYAYAERLTSIIDNFQDLSMSAPVDHQGPGETSNNSYGSGYSGRRQSSSQPDKTTGKGNRKQGPNKRRRVEDEGNDDEEEEYGNVMDRDDTRDPGDEPSTNVKLRCIFRARNPTRFNVRDHTSCAMTMFTGKHRFSDLRKHVLNKHAVDMEAASCQKCKQGFIDKKSLEFHIERENCIYKRTDPEDGITSETAGKIRFRGRECGPSDQEQWDHLWNLAFPDDTEIPSFKFIPVMEHYELEPTFMEKLEFLKPMVDEGTYEIVKTLFASAVNEMNQIGHRLSLEYENRQGSRSTPRTGRPGPRAIRENSHLRDSGIALDSEAGTPRTSARYSSSGPNSVTTPPTHSFSASSDFRPQQLVPLQPARPNSSFMFQNFMEYPELFTTFNAIQEFAGVSTGAPISLPTYPTGLEGSSMHPSTAHHGAEQLNAINPADIHVFPGSASGTETTQMENSSINNTFAARMAGEYHRPPGGFI